MGQDRLISTEAWVQPGRSEVRILTGARDFFSLKMSRRAPGPTQSPVQWVMGPLLPGVKCPGLMSSADLTLLPKLRMSEAMPVLPVCVFMAARYGSHNLVISVRSCFFCSCHFYGELAVLTILVFLCILFISQILNNLLLFLWAVIYIYIYIYIFYKTNYPDQI